MRCLESEAQDSAAWLDKTGAVPRQKEPAITLGRRRVLTRGYPVTDLIGSPRAVLLVLPSGVLERQVRDARAGDAEHIPDSWVALAQDVVEPVVPGSRQVAGEMPDDPQSGELPDGPQVWSEVWSGPEGELGVELADSYAFESYRARAARRRGWFAGRRPRFKLER